MPSVFMLVLVLLKVITQIQCRDIHITAPGDDTLCPQQDTCYSFTEFTANSSRFISSDTRLVFKSSEYNTSHMENNMTVVVRGIKNLVITGNSPFNQSTILCTGSTSLSFAFHNSTNITLQNIKLVACSNPIPRGTVNDTCKLLESESKKCVNIDLYATLYTNSVKNLMIANASVENSSQIGILVINNIGYLRIINSNLVNNLPHVVILALSNMWSDDSIFRIDFENSSLASNITTNNYHSRPYYLTGILVTVIVHNANIRTEIEIQKVQFTSNLTNYYKTVFKFIPCSIAHLKIANISSKEGLQMKILAGNCNICNKTLNTELIIDSCNFDMDHNRRKINIQLRNVNIVKIRNVNFTRSEFPVLFVENSQVYLREVQFTYNMLQRWDSTLVTIQNSKIYFEGNILFANNSGLAGGLQVTDTNMHFKGAVTFEGNIASSNGGAIAMFGKSYITFYKHTAVLYKNNHAEHAGGAIYVENDYITNNECFFNFMYNPITTNSSKIAFKGNTADYAGSIIYGGNVKRCIRKQVTFNGKKWYENLKIIFHLKYNTSDNSQITTKPYHVCQCSENTRGYKCSHSEIRIYPGQTYRLHLVIVGKTGDTVPGTIKVMINNGFTKETDKLPAIPQLQTTQSIGKTCKYFNVTVFSNNDNEILYLLPKGTSRYCNQNQYYNAKSRCVPRAKVKVTLKQCPTGFTLGNGECICNTVLQEHKKIHCDINTQTIYRTAPYWISADNNSNVVIHEHCPFDYCTSQDTPQLNLLQPDDQCANNRSGILCGQCHNNLSSVFGSSECRQCSNTWLLLAFVYALAGMVLILALTFLNMTVATGTINGLIFFANIVQANKVFFFPDTSHPLPRTLSLFIASLNLDSELPTCFYNGMDEYSKNWLYFLFPAYLWCVLIVFILLSNRSTRVARLCRSNVTSVLSTLFLLLYAKLLRVVTIAISFTELNYSNGTEIVVWLHDGNVDYGTGKHLALIMAAGFVLVIFAIPYTLFLLLFQFIQSKSNYKIFSWIHKITPFTDPYMAPYKPKHRYWTGLLLLFRAMIYTVFSKGDPQVNNLAIILSIAVLMLISALTGGVYKNKLLNLLEWTHYLNLLVLSATSLYALNTGPEGNIQARTILSSVLIGIAALIFICIVCYHAFIQIKSSFIGNICSYMYAIIEFRSSFIGKKVIKWWRKLMGKHNKQTTVQDILVDKLPSLASPTSSEIRMEDLQEPLLESYNNDS